MMAGEEKKNIKTNNCCREKEVEFNRSNILLKMAGYISTRGLNRKNTVMVLLLVSLAVNSIGLCVLWRCILTLSCSFIFSDRDAFITTFLA